MGLRIGQPSKMYEIPAFWMQSKESMSAAGTTKMRIISTTCATTVPNMF